MCDQSCFVLALWSKRRGKAEEYKIDGLLQENLVAQLESLKHESQDDFGPAYACQATNWSPAAMMPLLDFVYALDKERPDHWESSSTAAPYARKSEPTTSLPWPKCALTKE